MSEENTQQVPSQKTYVCMGSCQAVISEDQYKAGLTACGANDCTLHGQPFVEGKKSEVTGKNERTAA